MDELDTKTGENAISVTVADGWYKGKIALGHGCEYGEVPGALLQLELIDENGKNKSSVPMKLEIFLRWTGTKCGFILR